MHLRHAIAAALVSALAGPAGAATQYGIEVEPPELMFMMGQHAAAAAHELGRAGPADYAGAAERYRKAAVLGYPLSQNRLGRLYELGLGVSQDYVMAYVWYALAARSGDETSRENRDEAARRLSGADLARAQRIARRLGQHLP